MFNEDEKYNKLNQLALTNGRTDDNQSLMIMSSADHHKEMNPYNTRTIPALQLPEHEA